MKMNTLQKLRDCLDTLPRRVEMEEFPAQTGRAAVAADAGAVEVIRPKLVRFCEGAA